MLRAGLRQAQMPDEVAGLNGLSDELAEIGSRISDRMPSAITDAGAVADEIMRLSVAVRNGVRDKGKEGAREELHSSLASLMLNALALCGLERVDVDSRLTQALRSLERRLQELMYAPQQAAAQPAPAPGESAPAEDAGDRPDDGSDDKDKAEAKE